MILKCRSLIIILLVAGLPVRLEAQKAKNSQDSTGIFYRELFSALKKSYLHRNAVDWKSVESETMKSVSESESFNASLNEIEALFRKINAAHGTVFKGGKRYSLPAGIPQKEKLSEQWKKKYNSGPGFEVRLIDGKYGYILMPKINISDNRPDALHQAAQPLYDQIADLQQKSSPEGWIIDLRFNTGGNAGPMLLSLSHFLGNNTVWSSLDLNKVPVTTYSLSDGVYKMDSKKLGAIRPGGKTMEHVKVAVITGLLTASSGEVTALAFKGRPDTVFIGEPTLGYTTGNMLVKLPFGFEMALTTSYNGDRNGNYHERIIPDIPVQAQDNFDNLSEDPNILEAVKFFNRNN
jgi:hypothetical protein